MEWKDFGARRDLNFNGFIIQRLHLAASAASAFLTWVWCVHGKMPAIFTAVGVERINMEGPFQVLVSLPTHLTQMVSLGWNMGKLVVDSEVSWVSR